MNKQYLRPLCGALMVGVTALAQCAFAGTSTWKAGSTGGWNDPGSWDGGVPDSSTTVQVPDNVDLPVNDADAACAGSVSAITLGNGSRIVFNLTDSECTVNGTITGNGTIVKYGTNIVHLANETRHGYYATGGGMEVHEGILECPQTFSEKYSNDTMNIGPLYVAEGATFRPYARYRTTVVSSLTGKGIVMLPSTLTGGYWPFRYDSNELCSFEGAIAGKIMLQVNGPIDLMTDKNPFEGSFSLYNIKADVGVLKFGNGQEVSSSIGCCWFQWDSSDKNRYVNVSASGRIRYLGEGETSSRTFKLNGTGGQNFILDAGATGGLVLTGNFIATAVGQKVLTFAGSNTTVCVHSGGTGDYGDNTMYFAKSGTGIWRFEGNTNRLSRGVVGVEQGTLQFDSLTETNIPCSFGLSTRLAKKYATKDWDEAQRADYAILLGSADAEGVLEWVGTNLWDNASTTRPIAVTGMGGRIISSVAGRRIGLRGAFAADEGGGTLTLDGNGTTNYLYNVSDGHGKMSLAKDGSGTWVLAGDQTFSGKLAVNAGEVVVSATAGRKYSWYKFTVKELAAESSLRLREVALFNSSGVRLNSSLAFLGACAMPQPRQASVWGNQFSTYASSYNYGVDKLFDNSTNWKSIAVVSCGGSHPQPSDPKTWIPFVMRLNESDDDVHCYDFIPDQPGTGNGMPKVWTLEASADGVFWDKVHEVVDNENVCTDSSHWMSDDSPFSTSSAHISSYTFGLDNGKSLITGTPNQLSNATVTVAPGAVLRAEGDVTISALEGSAGGIGTIDGFALAQNGTFNLAGVDKLTDAVSIPVGFENVTGAENLSRWNLTVGGAHANGLITYANGSITVSPLGTRIILR